MAGALHSSIYTGMIVACAEPFAPDGWLPCDGSVQPQATYANLFAAIGHTYNGGTAPSPTTFRLPNLNAGLAPRGASPYYPAGTISGSNNHSHSFTTSVNASTNTDGSHNHSPAGSFTTSLGGGHSHNFNVGVSSGGSSSNMGNAKADGGTLATSRSTHGHDASMPGSTSDGSHSHSVPSVATVNFGGGHTHGGPNVSNSTINISSDGAPHHVVYYIIKT